MCAILHNLIGGLLLEQIGNCTDGCNLFQCIFFIEGHVRIDRKEEVAMKQAKWIVGMGIVVGPALFACAEQPHESAHDLSETYAGVVDQMVNGEELPWIQQCYNWAPLCANLGQVVPRTPDQEEQRVYSNTGQHDQEEAMCTND